MDLDVHAGDFGFAFEEFEQRVEREDHCQVDQRDCQIGAHEIEGGGGGAFGFRHQVLHGDQEHDRGRLKQRNRLVRPTRQRQAQRLGQYYVGNCLPLAQSDRSPRLHLCAANGVDRATQVFRLVSSAVEPQRQVSGNVLREGYADLWQTVIDNEELHKQRRAAEDRNVGAGKRLQPLGSIRTRQG